jgi:hypothetical protein
MQLILYRRNSTATSPKAKWSPRCCQESKKRQKLNEEMNDTGAAIHFAQDGHQFQEDVEAFVLESGAWDTPGERKQKESFWICHFKTVMKEDGGEDSQGGLNKITGAFSSLYGKI